MAVCISIEAATSSGPGQASSATGAVVLPWSRGDATFSAGEYTCATGTHLIMTIAEINAMPKTGVPDAVLMRETFFMSFSLVLGCYLLGKMVGAVLDLIKRG